MDNLVSIMLYVSGIIGLIVAIGYFMNIRRTLISRKAIRKVLRNQDIAKGDLDKIQVDNLLDSEVDDMIVLMRQYRSKI